MPATLCNHVLDGDLGRYPFVRCRIKQPFRTSRRRGAILKCSFCGPELWRTGNLRAPEMCTAIVEGIRVTPQAARGIRMEPILPKVERFDRFVRTEVESEVIDRWSG